MVYKFSKEERLKSKTAIDNLFKGHSPSEFSHPLKVVYQPLPTSTDLPKIAITVTKKKFKKATDRNLIKRRIREAYRLNNHNFKSKFEEAQCSINIIFIYVASTIETYQQIEIAMCKVLSKLKTSSIAKS